MQSISIIIVVINEQSRIIGFKEKEIKELLH